jgi:Leucine-rich repeat (LRR) protein
MVDHIYGRINLIAHSNRPNMFIKELSLYIDYLQNKIDESVDNFTNQKDEFFSTFRKNLIDGIQYYKSLIPRISEEAENVRKKIQEDLERLEEKLLSYQIAV